MEGVHPVASDPIPAFITAPDGTDYLFTIGVIVCLVAVFAVGVLYLRLHALPEQIAHKTNKIQLQLVAILGLLALFTHNHLFWIAGLLLAFVELPDFLSPVGSMARSLKKIADRQPVRKEERVVVAEPVKEVVVAPLPKIAEVGTETKGSGDA